VFFAVFLNTGAHPPAAANTHTAIPETVRTHKSLRRFPAAACRELKERAAAKAYAATATRAHSPPRLPAARLGAAAGPIIQDCLTPCFAAAELAARPLWR